MRSILVSNMTAGIFALNPLQNGGESYHGNQLTTHIYLEESIKMVQPAGIINVSTVNVTTRRDKYWTSLSSTTLFLLWKLCSISGDDYLLTVTSCFPRTTTDCLLRCDACDTEIHLASEHSLWPALTFGTSCQLLHEPSVPTHGTVSNENWRCSRFDERVSCCRWQQLRGTTLQGDYSKGYH